MSNPVDAIDQYGMDVLYLVRLKNPLGFEHLASKSFKFLFRYRKIG